MKRNIYLFKRNGGFYYVQFLDPITGKRTTACSTKTKDKEQAREFAYKKLYTQNVQQSVLVASVREALQNNSITASELQQLQALLNMQKTSLMGVQPIPKNQNIEIKAQTNTPLIQWLKDFWNYQTSEYVQDKLSHGMRVSERYCYEQTNIVKYWEEYFTAETMLETLSGNDLTDFEQYLYKKESTKKRTVVDEKTGKKSIEVYTVNLSTTTRNNIIKCASIAFEWALRKKLITENPCKALTAYSVKAQKRDILNRQEVEKLFSVGTWKDERARVASLVAMTTGLRISEILALQVDDIGEDRLYITNSWSPKDGLTTTKNGESRVVPLVPKVKAELLKLNFQNPHCEKGDKFIFYGNLANKPIVQNVITDGLKMAMESIGISENQRKKRNIVFHSWRHFYATTIATELSEKHAQLTLGHLTQAMTKHYADHKTEEALMSVCNASNDIFMNMLHA